jgi:hypothetical protein
MLLLWEATMSNGTKLLFVARISPLLKCTKMRDNSSCGESHDSDWRLRWRTLSSGPATAMLARPSGFPATSTMLDRMSSLMVECWRRKFSWRSRSPQGSASSYAGQYCTHLIPSDEDGINSIVVLQNRRFYARVVDR